MKLTVTGIERIESTAKITFQGRNEGVHYTTLLYLYIPFASHGTYQLGSEHEMELWAVMEEPATQADDPVRDYRPGGVMNNGL